MIDLIGLTGYKRSGKDTAAQALIEERGFIRVALADPLKAIAEEILLEMRLDEAGYSKEDLRPLYVALGAGARRNIAEDVWLDVAERKAIDIFCKRGLVVVTDVRYPNEAQWIAVEGGQLWRVVNPAVELDKDDPAEQYIDQLKPTSYFWNEPGDPGKMQKQVLAMVDALAR